MCETGPSYGGGYRPGYGTYSIPTKYQFPPTSLIVDVTFRLIGGYRPYRPPGGGYYGGYPDGHHPHYHNHGYPVDGGYVPSQGGVAPVGPGPAAPVAVNPSGARN